MSLLTMTSAPPTAAKIKYLSSFGSRHSRIVSVGPTPLRGKHHDIEDSLTTFGRDEAIKLRAKNDFAIFILNRLRQKQTVWRAHSAQ